MKAAFLWTKGVQKRLGKAPLQGSRTLKDALRGPRRPRSRRKALITRLDAIFSLFIRLRGKAKTRGLCELCGKRPIEVCFHWVSRGDYATRWLPENCVASCRGCNFEETFHKRKYRQMHIDRVGLAERDRLEALARTKTHYSEGDLETMACDFKHRMEVGDFGLPQSLYPKFTVPEVKHGDSTEKNI